MPTTGKLLRTLEGHTGAVYDVAFSPDSRFLVSASADDTCKVWRVEDGQRHGHASPAAQGRIRLRVQPRRPIDRRRRRRQQHPRLAVRLARQAGNQPDGDRPVRPRRTDRPAGVHARRLASSCRWPKTAPSRSGEPTTTASSSSGKTSPTCQRRWPSPATARSWSGGWTARWRATRFPRTSRSTPRPLRRAQDLDRRG